MERKKVDSYQIKIRNFQLVVPRMKAKYEKHCYFVHRSRRAAKKGKAWEKTYHMNTSDGYSVNMGGGVHIQITITEFLIEYSTARQEPRCSQDRECSGKKLTLSFIQHALVVWLTPYMRMSGQEI